MCLCSCHQLSKLSFTFTERSKRSKEATNPPSNQLDQNIIRLSDPFTARWGNQLIDKLARNLILIIKDIQIVESKKKELDNNDVLNLFTIGFLQYLQAKGRIVNVRGEMQEILSSFMFG